MRYYLDVGFGTRYLLGEFSNDEEAIEEATDYVIRHCRGYRNKNVLVVSLIKEEKVKDLGVPFPSDDS